MADGGGFKVHFGAKTARLLGGEIERVHPGFDTTGYADEVERLVEGRELKARVAVMAEGLRTRLPEDYVTAVAILVACLGDELAEGEGMFDKGWYLMPVARFVEDYGLDEPEASIEALVEITKRHTAEYAIRPYVEHHYELTMGRLRELADDSSHNVRRMVSEGLRPRLPWATRLACFIADPGPVLEIIERLRSDPSLYVRKSVANNLNDIAKDHPEQVVATSRRWLVESPTAHTSWIVEHGLRTLIKRGHPGAIAVRWPTRDDQDVRVNDFEITPAEIAVGGAVTLHLELCNHDPAEHEVNVDYVIHHLRRDGTTHPRVFKLRKLRIGPGERRAVEKIHRITPVRTRTYNAGEHLVEIRVDGRVLAGATFRLTT